MNTERFVVDAFRVAVVLALALAAMVPLRKRSAAARRVVLVAALAGSLAMPALSALAPSWSLPAQVAVSTGLHVREVTEALVEGSTPAASAGSKTEDAATAVAPRASSHVEWSVVLAFVWAGGALVVLARFGAGVLRARALVKGAERSTAWSMAVARAQRVTGLRADVRVSDAVHAPAVTGMVAPVVLVPRASEAWDDERRHAVLLHELAHVRQMDCLAQVVAQLACAVHWFDPLAWFAASRLRYEREVAADDAVLVAGARASHYAEELVAIASAAWASEAPSAALGMGERSHLAARVRAIVSPGRVRRSLARGHAASLLGASSLVVLGVACTAPTASGPGVAGGAAPPAPAEPVAPSSASTVRPELQKVADAELDRTLATSGGVAGAILVLDPATGEILADAGRSHGAPFDVAVGSAYVTGSTLKSIVLAAALDEGVVSPGDRFDCGQGSATYQGKVLHDHDAFGVLTVEEMLAVSSNVGFARVFDRLGGERLGRSLRAFHFGEAPLVDGAVAGWMPERPADGSFVGATTAIGEVVQASPLQVAAAYAAIANGGQYMAPTRMHRATPAQGERVIKAETASELVTMLEGVVYGERATGKLAQVQGARVAGKTGTASWDLPKGGEGIYASFVGFVPSRSPRFVILVGVENPKGDAGGPTVAAPAFARVASRALATP